MLDCLSPVIHGIAGQCVGGGGTTGIMGFGGRVQFQPHYENTQSATLSVFS